MSNQEQLLRGQLGLANSGYEAERQMRLLTERRTARLRVLFYDLAVRLVPADLDNLRKERGEVENPQVLSDEDLAQWLKQTLDGYLFHYRQLISGREANYLARLKGEHDQARHDAEQAKALLDQVRADLRAATERGDVLAGKLSALQTEHADVVANLDTSRTLYQQARAELMTARQQLAQQTTDTTPANPVIESTAGPIAEATDADAAGTQPLWPVTVLKLSDAPLVDYPAPSDQTPAWYANWLATTKLEERDRQSAVIHLLATGQAFFRIEVIEQLHARRLIHEPDLDHPTGGTNRLFSQLISTGFIEEIDGGYGSSVPAALSLTAQGREAYQVFFGGDLPESIFARLARRHKTPEHTVLNLLARRVLLKFGFQSVELFPERVPLTEGAPAEPDLTAIAPDGQTIYLECERGVTVRSAEKRDAKWNRTAELSRGHLYLFVPHKTARSAVYSELSQWLYQAGDRWPKVELHICEYSKALTAPTIWTYSTTVSR